MYSWSSSCVVKNDSFLAGIILFFSINFAYLPSSTSNPIDNGNLSINTTLFVFDINELP